MGAQYDKVPAWSLTCRVMSSQYLVELYEINRVLCMDIHPNNDLLTSYNSPLHGSEFNVNFSRLKTLRVDFRFPCFQNLTLSQHTIEAQHKFLNGQFAKLLELVRTMWKQISRIWGDHPSKIWVDFDNLSIYRTSLSRHWTRILIGKSGRSQQTEL